MRGQLLGQRAGAWVARPSLGSGRDGRSGTACHNWAWDASVALEDVILHQPAGSADRSINWFSKHLVSYRSRSRRQTHHRAAYATTRCLDGPFVGYVDLVLQL